MMVGGGGGGGEEPRLQDGLKIGSLRLLLVTSEAT